MGKVRTTTAPMYQTMVPFVEIFIKGKDILRSLDGKPKTLVSFSYTHIMGDTAGDFSFEVFDPDFVAIEELMLSTNTSGLEIAEEAYEADSSNPSPNSPLVPIYFRFGYVSQDGKVLSKSGESYFVGAISHYTPTMATNGVQLSVRGNVWGEFPAKHLRKKILPQSYNMSLYDTVKKVCTLMEWDFRSVNDDGLELPEGQQPESLFDCNQDFETTEEKHKSFKMKDNETALQFISRIVQDARPKDSKYGLYSFNMIYEASSKEGKSKGTLYFGPQDFGKDPVRRYIFMRDAESDVITFAPTVNGIPSQIVGKDGSVVKTENPETGEVSVKIKNEANRYLAYYTGNRTATLINRPQSGEYATGFIDPESKAKDIVNNIEGTNTGSQTMAPREAHHLDDNVITEISVRETGKRNGDRQSMNHFLATQIMAATATLEIFGDPSSELKPMNNVVVFVLVPTGDGRNFRMHYTSNIYGIQGVHHQISGGTYTTTLELFNNSIGSEAGVTSKALYVALEDLVGAENASRVY